MASWKLLVLAGMAIAPFYAQRPVPGEAGKSDYVDARLCAPCHRQIAQDYAKTGMGRSFFRPSPGNTIEDYAAAGDFYHALSDTHFSMILRDGRYYQRRRQTGPDGNEINAEEMTVDYVMGSGNHARSYLHRTARGTLIELPLGWYPRVAGNWAMSPGSDSDHPRTRRFVSYKCMFCHNGIPRIPAGHDEPGSDPAFTGDLPEGIDCQRCHGPGGKHLRVVANRASTRADVLRSVVNPARLSSKLRMEICMQCHLETSSGRIPSALVRFDRGPFSYVPGEPLDAFMLAFDHAPGTGHDAKFEAVSSVYRLRQSRCFLKSEGKLTCDTCHDPHRVPRGAEAVSHYSAVCMQCHARALGVLTAAGDHTAASDCTRCHMPKRRAQDTPGMIMTDHLIQRRPPAGDLLAEFREPAPEEYHGEVVPYPRPLPQTPLNTLYLAVAQVGNQNNLEAGLPLLAREVAKQKPGNAEFYNVLGDSWLRTGKPGKAVAAYEQALRLKPDSPAALRALAAGLSEAGENARAEETLQRAVRMAPSDPIGWYRFGLLDLAAGRATAAAEKIRKAIDLDPDLPEQSRSLAQALVQAGRPQEAETALREALRTDPYDDAAWDLSGRVLTGKGEMPEAYHDFEKAIGLRPGYAPHHYDFALALVRGDRFDEAREHAEAALRADPNLADAHELLGGLFARTGQLPEAAREYRRTLELQPASARAHLHLGNVLAAQGDTAGASEHFREAARGSDPAIAQQAAQALRQTGVR